MSVMLTFCKISENLLAFTSGSKNSFYHPFHVKPRGDYLKKTMVNLKKNYISGQSATRVFRAYNFAGVDHRFFEIIRPQCGFCGNLQHLLHAVKRLLRICRIQIEPTRF
jgi:hypothetical protein